VNKLFKRGRANATRSSQKWPIDSDYKRRDGFALDYQLDPDNGTLWAIGWNIGANYREPVSLVREPFYVKGFVPARIGDADGANLPWFTLADSTLLFWQIHKEVMDIPLEIEWYEVTDGQRAMDIRIPTRRHQPLLRVEMQGDDMSTISVIAPVKPLSSSPSKTYPIRVAIIYVIAPTAIFVNDLLGNVVGAAVSASVDFFLLVFVIVLYGFLGVAVIISLMRALGRGPSLEGTYERMQGGLQKLVENERMGFLHIHILQEKMDWMYHTGAFKRTVDICRNGWHPEREAAERAETEASDIEKAKPSS
jgi:hypothetical protein